MQRSHHFGTCTFRVCIGETRPNKAQRTLEKRTQTAAKGAASAGKFSATATRATTATMAAMLEGATRGPQRPHKHKDPTF